MTLTPREKDKLMIAMAAEVARLRLARDGRSPADLMADGVRAVRRDQCMEGIAMMIPGVKVEPTLPDGIRPVTVHHPVR